MYVRCYVNDLKCEARWIARQAKSYLLERLPSLSDRGEKDDGNVMRCS